MIPDIAFVISTAVCPRIRNAAGKPVQDIRNSAKLSRRFAKKLRINKHRPLIFRVDVRINPLRIRSLLNLCVHETGHFVETDSTCLDIFCRNSNMIRDDIRIRSVDMILGIRHSLLDKSTSTFLIVISIIIMRTSEEYRTSHVEISYAAHIRRINALTDVKHIPYRFAEDFEIDLRNIIHICTCDARDIVKIRSRFISDLI